MKAAVRTAALLIVSIIMSSLAAADATPDSAAFDTSCAMCHQRGGVGLTGQFPRLAGRVNEIAATETGRRYLLEVTQWGMAGKIDVDGAPIIGAMPAFSALSDEALAAALNYAISLDSSGKSSAKKRPKITASDVAQIRLEPALSPTQVRESRKRVLQSGGK